MKLRVVLVGSGEISEIHMSAWKQHEDAEVKVVVDIDRELAVKKAQKWGINEVESDYQTVLRRQDIDAVDLCLPHDLHAPFVCDALEAGKHVLVEKPLATTISDAERMVRTAETSRYKLMVAENFRYDPIFTQAKAILDRGEVGKPYHISSRLEFYMDDIQKWYNRWRRIHERVGGGILIDTGIHSLSAMRAIMGETESIFAIRGKQVRNEIAPLEDTVSLLLRFVSGSTGQASYSFGAKWSKIKIDFVVYGSEGILGFDLTSSRIFQESKNLRLSKEIPRSILVGGFVEEVRHFIDCIAQDREPITSASEELKTLRTVFAGYESIRTGKLVILGF